MIWVTVPGWPHLEVSDEGWVRTALFESPLHWGRGVRTYGGGKGSPGVWDKKHKRYFIYSKKAGFNLKVARLVCETFNGPPTEDKPYVLHRDENPRNNRPENLYWGTQKENLNAPGFLAYCRTRTGENHPKRRGANATANRSQRV